MFPPRRGCTDPSNLSNFRTYDPSVFEPSDPRSFDLRTWDPSADQRRNTGRLRTAKRRMRTGARRFFNGGTGGCERSDRFSANFSAHHHSTRAIVFLRRPCRCPQMHWLLRKPSESDGVREPIRQAFRGLGPVLSGSRLQAFRLPVLAVAASSRNSRSGVGLDGPLNYR